MDIFEERFGMKEHDTAVKEQNDFLVPQPIINYTSFIPIQNNTFSIIDDDDNESYSLLHHNDSLTKDTFNNDMIDKHKDIIKQQEYEEDTLAIHNDTDSKQEDDVINEKEYNI